MQQGEAMGNLFDPMAARFNHSCEPNCALRFIGSQVEVVALRDLKEGEEAKLAYVDVAGEGRDAMRERRRELMENWYFDCQCERCMREVGGGDQSIMST